MLTMLLALGCTGAGDNAAQLADAAFQSENVSALVQPAMRKVTLVSARPASVRVAPPAKIAVWAAWPFGPKDHTRSITVALTDATSAPPRAWADGNGDGDFSNDPPITIQAARDAAGQITHWLGEFYVTAPAISQRPLRVKFLRHTADEAAKRKLPDNLLLCCADYGWTGKLVVGQKKFAAVLMDASATGDFTLPRESPAGLSMYVDVNGNGTFEGPERFGPNETINLGTTAVVLSEVSADGKDIKWTTAGVGDPRMRVSEADGDLGPAPKFEGMTLDGKKVSFPGDFKGKLVLLDFWATWCVPCQMEVPHLVEAHKKHHAAGLELLSVSIDSPRDVGKLRAMAKQKGMVWQHVHPGNVIGGVYGVSTIPRAFLVDGDTGKIVASGAALRGDSLAPTVAAAMRKKFGAAAPVRKP